MSGIIEGRWGDVLPTGFCYTVFMEQFKDAKFVLVIGIGGSDLASKAVWQAISQHQKKDKQAFFLEAPDEREYAEIAELLKQKKSKPEDFAIITISKSGKTEETLTTFNKIFELFVAKFGETVNERCVIVSTKESPLWQLGNDKNIKCLEWEGDVGGRFSAFTIAHTTVLTILDLDTGQFIQGSKDGGMGKSKIEADKLAQEIFENHKSGLNILDFFIFNSELEDLGKWCRQLIGESLGLLTPTVSLGPTDLHSMLELYLGGPKTRFTIFVRSLSEIDETLNESAYQNVVKAYRDAELPFMTYEIQKIDERNLGEFMAFMIAMTLELARLLEVNPYDQPAVENYKNSLHN